MSDEASRPLLLRRSFEVIEIPDLRGSLIGAARLLAETVLVPSVLLVVLLHCVGLLAGIATAVGWCLLTLFLRWIFRRPLPRSMVLGVVMLIGKAGVAIATSSAVLLVLQPAFGSTLMALLFIGSAALGRPVTMRLAHDFVRVPQHLLARREIRRTFSEVAVIWGLSRLVDAAMTIGTLRLGVDVGLLSRSLLSPLLSVLTIVACTLWARRSFRRHGVRLRLQARPSHAALS